MGNRGAVGEPKRGHKGKPVVPTAKNPRPRARGQHFQPAPVPHPSGGRGRRACNRQTTHPDQQAGWSTLVAFKGFTGGKVALTFWIWRHNFLNSTPTPAPQECVSMLQQKSRHETVLLLSIPSHSEP